MHNGQDQDWSEAPHSPADSSLLGGSAPRVLWGRARIPEDTHTNTHAAQAALISTSSSAPHRCRGNLQMVGLQQVDVLSASNQQPSTVFIQQQGVADSAPPEDGGSIPQVWDRKSDG